MPLAQKRHWTGQPTWELTHAVRRGPSGIITVSALGGAAGEASGPADHSRSSFSVPSELDWRRTGFASANEKLSASRARSSFDRFVICSGPAISLRYTQSRS